MLSKLSRSSRLCTDDGKCSRATTTCVSRPTRLVCRAAQDDSVPVFSRVFAAATAASVALSGLYSGTPLAAAAPLALARQYEQQVQRLHHKHPLSNLPSSDESAALQLLLDQDLFTPEAWEGMLRLQQYAQYVEQLSASGVEDGPGCESCTANRMMLEKVRWAAGACGGQANAAGLDLVAWGVPACGSHP